MIRLGANVSRDHDFGAELGNVLAGLDACALGRIQILFVIVYFRAAAFAIEHEEKGGPSETWIDFGLRA